MPADVQLNFTRIDDLIVFITRNETNIYKPLNFNFERVTITGTLIRKFHFILEMKEVILVSLELL